jgi:HK97 family phage portal protein
MAFVVTSGQIQAVEAADDGPSPLAGVSLSPSLSVSYEALWRAQPALRTVIGFLARNVAQLGLDPYERVGPTDRRKLHDHPLARLLERPLNGSNWTKYRLISALMHDLCLFDSAYWLKVRGDNQVKAIVPVPHRMIRPIGRSWLAPEAYRIEGSRGRYDVAPDGVVHFHGYNPDDPRDGVTPIEALRQILAEEYAATLYREQLWRNGARVAGYISRPADAPQWSPAAKDRFRRDWHAAYTGHGPDAGGTPVLEDGMSFDSTGISPKDAQYVESRKLTREEVAVAYHVQPVLLGLMDGANFSSVTEIHRWLYQDTLAPYLTQIGQDIECQLLGDLDPGAAESGRVYVEFNLQEKLRGSFEQQAAAISSSVGGPWMTRDEARALNNLPHIDGAEELIVPLNVITGGLASPRDTAPNNPSNEASNGQLPKARRAVKARLARPSAGPLATVMRGYFDRQGRAVTARAGAGKAKADDLVDVFDDDRWDTELADDLAPVTRTITARAGRSLLEALRLDPGGYDVDRTRAWLTAHAAALAAAINAVTKTGVGNALRQPEPAAALRDLFAGYADTRADLIAGTETAHLTGWAGVEALDQTGADGTKTWTTGPNPRPAHAALSGQTVGAHDVFANGARWPGDSVLDADERAGCNCDVEWGVG